MKALRVLLPGLLLILTGCTETATDSSLTDPDAAVAPESDLGMPEDDLGVAETQETETPDAADLPGDGTNIALTQENTKIEFIGSHVVEEKPDPEARRGQFQKFSGTAVVQGNQLQSLMVVIETESVTTDNEKLTGHLKSADFFDVREHPKASFTSSSVTAGEGDQVTITGDLTLLGTTKEISFPATVAVGEDLHLDAEFTLDRSEFGMNYGTDKVEKDVTMMISVGE